MMISLLSSHSYPPITFSRYFLTGAVSQPPTQQVVVDVLLGHHSSSRSQYESYWKAFQRFVASCPITYYFPRYGVPVPLFHFSWIFGNSPLWCIIWISRSPFLTASSWHSVLAWWNYSEKGSSINTLLHSHPHHPVWSLQKVFDYLGSLSFYSDALAEWKLEKAVFLEMVVFGMGLWQLPALANFPA